MPFQDTDKNDIVFQSTLPTRGSDGRRAMEKILRSEISIHAPHEGERPQAGDMRPRRKNISIHAPHEGERHGYIYRHAIAAGISIHAPHEGERHLIL